MSSLRGRRRWRRPSSPANERAGPRYVWLIGSTRRIGAIVWRSSLAWASTPARRDAMKTALPSSLGKPISPRTAAITPSMLIGTGRPTLLWRLVSIAIAAATWSPASPASPTRSSSRSSRGSRRLCWRCPNPGIRRPSSRHVATSRSAACGERGLRPPASPPRRRRRWPPSTTRRRRRGTRRAPAGLRPSRPGGWPRPRSRSGPRGPTGRRRRDRCSPPSPHRSVGPPPDRAVPR